MMPLKLSGVHHHLEMMSGSMFRLNKIATWLLNLVLQTTALINQSQRQIRTPDWVALNLCLHGKGHVMRDEHRTALA